MSCRPGQTLNPAGGPHSAIPDLIAGLKRREKRERKRREDGKGRGGEDWERGKGRVKDGREGKGKGRKGREGKGGVAPALTPRYAMVSGNGKTVRGQCDVNAVNLPIER